MSDAHHNGTVSMTSEPTEDWRKASSQGLELLREGKSNDAIELLRRAASIRPDHVPTLINFGAALQRTKKFQDACNVFEIASRRAPESAIPHHGRGLALSSLGERERAITAFKAATARDPTAWKSWMSIAEITPDENVRLNAIAGAVAALGRKRKAAPEDASLLIPHARLLVRAHLFHDAMDAIEESLPLCEDKSTALSIMAGAHYVSGDFKGALTHQQRAILALKPEALPDAPPASLRFDSDRATTALLDIQAILNAKHIRCFLAAGTLLGFHRSGAPLAHDRDVDLGVMTTDQRAPDVIRVLRENPDIMLPIQYRPGDRYMAVSHKGVSIDIFLHTSDNDHTFCGFSDLPGDIAWRYTKFGLKQTQYSGAEFLIPDEPERYLAETYGENWRTPDKGFASAVSSPALHDVDPYARAHIAATRARLFLLAGNRTKARALAYQSPIKIRLPDVAEHPERIRAPDPNYTHDS